MYWECVGGISSRLPHVSSSFGEKNVRKVLGTPSTPHSLTLSPLVFVFFSPSYAELIADWPVVVLGVCTVLIVVCALVGILVPDLPDFSDPLLVSADSQMSSSLHKCQRPSMKTRTLNWRMFGL